ncbi:60S ribosomal protein L3-1 [Sesamum angolense]|uniref:60S ribosomal protein L3-1 n=1 Tax=Sesamum angolense TaxID=2727404 RepID=A0AAE1X5E8_9LAMI|nr:60S ribosomal protein L3-1 [Sesamum angolense]
MTRCLRSRIDQRTEKDITPMGGLPHHGVMKDDYLMIKGCCVGPKKRIITLRQTLINQISRVALEEIKLKFETLAQTELRWQGVKDLPSAIAAPDRLDDFKMANDPKQRNDDSRKGKEKFGKKFKKKEKAKEVVT